MPEYTYKCDRCASRGAITIVCPISEYQEKPNCPYCKKNDKIYRDYSVDCVYGAYSYSLSDCTTVGQYAEKQTKKLGKEKVQLMLESFKTKKESETKWPDGMKKITDPRDMPRGPRRSPDEIKAKL